MIGRWFRNLPALFGRIVTNPPFCDGRWQVKSVPEKLTGLLRRWMYRPEWHEIVIARLTGEDPFDVHERIRDSATGTPYSVLTIAAIELARVRSRTSRTLTETLEILGARKIR